MPTYPYRCANGHTRDLICSADDPTKALYDRGLMACEHEMNDGEPWTDADGQYHIPLRDADGNLLSYQCGATYKRVWTRPALGPTFVPHFNDSVGEYVTSQADFNRKLARNADAYMERTGLKVDWQPVDLRDEAVRPKNDDGMQSTHDAKVARGEIDPTRKFL